MWSFIKRKKLWFIALCLFTFLNNLAVAQDDPDLPCDNVDPYADCPLDTWNYVLIATGLVLGTCVLYKQQCHQAAK